MQLDEARFIRNLVAEFNKMENPGERFITPPSHFVAKLNDAIRHYNNAGEVQLDTVVLTFWAAGSCLFSINLLRWPDAALSELFDIVYPKLYDNREFNTAISSELWLQ